METFNVAQPLVDTAARVPFRPATIFPAGRDRTGRARYTQLTFQQLNGESDRYAHGLSAYGIRRGDRTLMMIRPGVAFMAVTFALQKIGAVPVFIDPGLLRRDTKAFVQCVQETEPVHFIGIPVAHLLRPIFPQAFRTVRHYFTAGRRWFWQKGATLDELRTARRDPFPVAPTTIGDEAAVAFTSGSTGTPKGVVYTHGIFRAQIDLMRDEMGYADGEVDLPGLYIFALFNPALGVTTVIPDMDPGKVAALDPAALVEAIQTHGVTASNGSPTIFGLVARYCLDNEVRLPSLKRILTYGAPIPPALIAQYHDILEEGDVYTPYGATEALPVTMINGHEILDETAELTERGRGMCVGRPTTGNTVRIIRITDEQIPEWDTSLVLPGGQVGEIVVKGPVVTRAYLHRPVQTAAAKIREGTDVWHRMGDLGYVDDRGRLWFCGRKVHRVETARGRMLPVQCEAIFNHHPDVARTALVGVGPLGRQRPVLVVEPKPGQMPTTGAARWRMIDALLALGAAHDLTREVRDVLFHPAFPVDVRHNAKIQREKLAIWATGQLDARSPGGTA